MVNIELHDLLKVSTNRYKTFLPNIKANIQLSLLLEVPMQVSWMKPFFQSLLKIMIFKLIFRKLRLINKLQVISLISFPFNVEMVQKTCKKVLINLQHS